MLYCATSKLKEEVKEPFGEAKRPLGPSTWKMQRPFSTSHRALSLV